MTFETCSASSDQLPDAGSSFSAERGWVGVAEPPAAACDLPIRIEHLLLLKGGINMRAVQLTSFGDPVDGLQYVDIPEPDAPGPNQVLIGVEFSPINPNDLMVAQGTYAIRPPLPAIIGNEGVGRVLALGPGVENVRVGDGVLAPLSSSTWRERMVVSASGLSTLPADADTQQLAMLAINPPTAALLL